MVDSIPPIFYAPGSYGCGDVITIAGEEASHITQSRRMRIGDEVHITDGIGKQAIAIIQDIAVKAKTIDLQINQEKIVAEPQRDIILVSAIAKGDRQSIMLNMATQLGMRRYLPLLCEHSVVVFQEKMRQRWHRIILGACKQSRQCYFPTIGEQVDLQSLVLRYGDDAIFMVGDPDGEDIFKLNHGFATAHKQVFLLVGPEGGFSRREREIICAQNVLKLRLGRQILRTETAAVAMLAALNQIL